VERMTDKAPPALPRYTMALLKNVRDRARGGSVGSLTAASTWGSIAAAIQTDERVGAEALLEAALTQTLADPDTELILVEERKEVERDRRRAKAATACAAKLAFRAHMVGEGDPVGLAKRVRCHIGDETLAGIGLTPDLVQGLVDERINGLAVEFAAKSAFRARILCEGDPVGFAKRMRDAVGDGALARIGLAADYVQGLVDERLERLAAMDIATPTFDKIFVTQDPGKDTGDPGKDTGDPGKDTGDPEAMRWIYALLGRMLYNVGGSSRRADSALDLDSDSDCASLPDLI
jgi:hypothetical protein